MNERCEKCREHGLLHCIRQQQRQAEFRTTCLKCKWETQLLAVCKLDYGCTLIKIPWLICKFNKIIQWEPKLISKLGVKFCTHMAKHESSWQTWTSYKYDHKLQQDLPFSTLDSLTFKHILRQHHNRKMMNVQIFALNRISLFLKNLTCIF